MTGARVLEPVTLTITCRTSPEPGARGRRHPITLEADGSITTPHDLDSERLAVALGGYLTCVDLVDRTAPLLREWVGLQRRDAPLPIRSPDQGRRWHALQRGSCCPGGGFTDPCAAADHARGSRHLALSRGTDARRLQTLVKGVAVPDSGRRVGEPWDTLWACGIHHDHIDRIDERLALGAPLEPMFYLAVVQQQPDLDWLREMVAAAGRAPRTAEWLAWTYGPSDRQDPAARVEWLRLAVPVRAIADLMGCGVEPAQIARLSGHWKVTNATAALLMQEWVRQGLLVPVEALMGPATAHLGYPPHPPGRESIARLRQAMPSSTREDLLSDLELALALVEHGSVGSARAALIAHLERPGQDRAALGLPNSDT